MRPQPQVVCPAPAPAPTPAQPVSPPPPQCTHLHISQYSNGPFSGAPPCTMHSYQPANAARKHTSSTHTLGPAPMSSGQPNASSGPCMKNVRAYSGPLPLGTTGMPSATCLLACSTIRSQDQGQVADVELPPTGAPAGVPEEVPLPAPALASPAVSGARGDAGGARVHAHPVPGPLEKKYVAETLNPLSAAVPSGPQSSLASGARGHHQWAKKCVKPRKTRAINVATVSRWGSGGGGRG